jgi:hypothetical protein
MMPESSMKRQEIWHSRILVESSKAMALQGRYIGTSTNISGDLI